MNQPTFTPLSHVKIEVEKIAEAKRDLILINKIDFAAKNLTSNAGLFLLLENAKANGIFELIDTSKVTFGLEGAPRKPGVSSRVKVLGEQGLTSHSYRVLQ